MDEHFDQLTDPPDDHDDDVSDALDWVCIGSNAFEAKPFVIQTDSPMWFFA